MRTISDVTNDLSAVILNENFIAEITPKIQQLANTLKITKEITERTQDANQSARNEHRKPRPSYKPGDKVWVQCHFLSKAAQGFAAKLAPRRDGPYLILRQRGPASYEIANTKEPTIPIGVYHASALTTYVGDIEKLPEPVNPIRKRGRPPKKKEGSTKVIEPSQPKNHKLKEPGPCAYRLRNQRGRM
ncbi:hypothetical protein ABEB36_000322 [Hypothenemus hampei]